MHKMVGIIFTFTFAFAQNVIAEIVDGYCLCEIEFSECCKKENVGKKKFSIDTNNAGIIRTIKTIDSGDTYEYIAIFSDTAGNLIHSLHRIMKGADLVKEIRNGVARDIIKGETPCNFTIVESSGDTIPFRLNPEKEYDDVILTNNILFLSSSPKYEYLINNSDVYGSIIFGIHRECRYWHYMRINENSCDDRTK